MTGARSKAVATWLAVIGGSLGLHRFYLYGARDVWAWLHLPLTLVGAYGFWRMRQFGAEDRLGSELVPLLGAMVAVAMLSAIVCGLMPDERWQARHGQRTGAAPTGRLAILGVIVALALGATVTMATIAFTAQRYFESQAPG